MNAAFRDPRFDPLVLNEVDAVKLEISVLSAPEKLIFESPAQLLEQLHPGVHGVILSRGGQRATFLPQVWEQLPGKQDFLAHLCRKAGMGSDCWMLAGVDVAVYRVIHFSE